MPKISDMNGNRSGSYRDIFDDERLGHLISQTHAAAIRFGTELERVISSLVPQSSIATVQSIAQTIARGEVDPLIPKHVIFKPTKPPVGRARAIVCDFAIFFHQDQEFYVVELKLGHDFDTQKSEAAHSKLQTICEFLTGRTGYTGRTYIASFSATSKKQMLEGFKGYFHENEVMLGPELCFYMGVDYEEVLQRLKVDQDANKEYFLGQIDKIQNGLPKEEYFAQIDRRKKRGITDAQQEIPIDPPEDIQL
ncbi:hypothetical protein [Kouleothrix sp.]|uniref:hypothetical protein n=1 Tax=Kouleothrix sp. TaxID=2779161 RepID=UPI00391D95B0